MIKAIQHNLERGVNLLTIISNNQYANCSVEPYNSSIGGHMRHILDMFDCIFRGVTEGTIDLTTRTRNTLAEENTQVGLAYFKDIISRLDALDKELLEQKIAVTDDLGLGKITANYTVAAVLIQAHSHAIHHFASIGYIISQLGIELPDADFGFNPSTPKKVRLNLN